MPLREDGTYNLSDGNEYATEDELIVCNACRTEYLLEYVEGDPTLIPLNEVFDLELPGGPKGRLYSDDKSTTIEAEGSDGTMRLELSLVAVRRVFRRLLAHI